VVSVKSREEVVEKLRELGCPLTLREVNREIAKVKREIRMLESDPYYRKYNVTVSILNALRRVRDELERVRSEINVDFDLSPIVALPQQLTQRRREVVEILRRARREGLQQYLYFSLLDLNTIIRDLDTQLHVVLEPKWREVVEKLKELRERLKTLEKCRELLRELRK